MRITYEWRVFQGHRVIDRGADTATGVYSTLQVYGYYWLVPFLVSLERAQSLDVGHPKGIPWRFVIRLDYHDAKRGNSRLRSVRLITLPQLNRFQIPSIELWPELELQPKLTLPVLTEYLRAYQPH